VTRAPRSSWRVGLAALAIALALPAKADDPRVAASAVIEGENILAHIRQLASDEFEGRAPGTRGEVLTTRYLASQFQSFGLKPGNPDGTYFQDVPLVGYRTVPQIRISAGGTRIALRYPEDFVHDFPALRASARIFGAGVVFAGYGIVAPAYGWDDYRNLDVRNKLRRRAVAARARRLGGARPGLLQGRSAYVVFHAGVQVRRCGGQGCGGHPRRHRPREGQDLLALPGLREAGGRRAEAGA